ncbi:MAG: sugar MFS transporter [Chitinophagales bacterium]|nr:sugar MFS transporter [Chitinophagales bacterium]
MQTDKKQSYTTSLILVGLLYFIFGFITWLNGTLIPFLKAVCQLNNFQSYFVTFAFFISYFVMALPSSAILNKTGFKKGMSLGLLVMAGGALLFIPAAMQRNYMLFLTGLFTEGLGLAILQTAVNPYVTILGPAESAASRISMMGIANKAAGMILPAIMAGILLSGVDGINEQVNATTDIAQKEQLLSELAQRIINPYIVLAIVLVVLALLIRVSPLPDVNDTEENPDTDDSTHPTIWHHTYLILGALAIFFYVGVEVIAGDSIISYGTSMGIPIEEAKWFTSFTLGCMVAGYFAGIILTPRIISQELFLRICTVLGLVLVVGVLTTTGKTSVYFLASLGFAHAIMWPAIWPMSLKGLGKFTKTGSALLIMGIAGGAILPLLYGKMVDISGNRAAYWVMIPCYLYILFFALAGHKIGYKKK